MNDSAENKPKTAAELLNPILDRIDQREAVEHIRFPLAGLNKLAPLALAPGRLTVIAGHSGHCSTTLALDIARCAAVSHEIPTALTALMSSPAEITQRILASEAGVPVLRIATGDVNDDDQRRINIATSEIKAAPLYIDENPLTLSAIRGNPGLRLAVIDNAHWLHEGHFADTPGERSAAQSLALKRLAMDAGIAIVVTVPLVGGGGRAVPFVSHFGPYAPFLLDADLVLLTYRPDAVEREDPRAGEVDITIAKHRNGPTGVVTACAQTHYSRIVDFQS